MDITTLNKITTDRQQKCKEGYLHIDTFNGLARGYTKAGKIQSSVLVNPTQKDCHETSPNISNAHNLPSGFSIFEYLGVDAV